MPRTPRDPTVAFWTFVDVRGPDDCWLWEGGVRPSQSGEDYPVFWIGSKRVMAHRYSIELVTGVPVPRSKLACHHCDTPLCVNPRHLYVGTTKTNAEDREQRRRRDTRPGERHHNARLTSAQAAAIRHRYLSGGVTQAQLADEYGIGRTQIGRIVNGDRWGGPRRAVVKGRPRALTEAQEAALVSRYRAGGVTQAQLGAEYGLTQAGVGLIIRRH
jgi:hypothetical protein